MNASLHRRQPSASSIFGGSLAWLRQQVNGALPTTAASHTSLQVLVLDAGDTIEVPQPLRSELVCLKGRLWITHDHEPADVVIERGQCYRPDSGSRMTVHAIGDARLMVRTLHRD